MMMKNSETLKKHTCADSCDLLLLFVNDNERDAVFAAAQKFYSITPRIRPSELMTYHDFGEIEGVRVMGLQTRMGSSGRGASGPATLTAINELNPEYIIAVGLAFGMDKDAQKIGEIMISEKVANYESGKIKTTKRRSKKTPTWVTRGDDVSVPERLFGKLRAVSAPVYWKGASIHFGQILSGEKLIDCDDFKQNLKREYPEAICGEMEATGIYASAELKKKDWIIVKAVCDHADGNKGVNKEENQKLAAANAAEFVLFTLSCGVFADAEFQSPGSDIPVQNEQKNKNDRQYRDSQKQGTVKENIKKLLNDAGLKLLRESLIEQLKVNHDFKHSNGVDLEQTIIDLGILESVYILKLAVHGCMKKLKSEGANHDRLMDIWNGGVDILGWLLLLSVNYQCVNSEFSYQNDENFGMKLEIPVLSETGIEIVFSSLLEERPVRLEINESKTRLYGNSRICCPNVETGWDSNDHLQTIKKNIWRAINKSAKYEDTPRLIDAYETEKLNERLAIRNRDSDPVYFTISGVDTSCDFDRKEILSMLSREFSALHIISVTIKSKMDSRTIFIVSEPKLEGSLLEFFLNKPE